VAGQGHRLRRRDRGGPNATPGSASGSTSAGTSAGSIVAALLVAGYDAAGLQKILADAEYPRFAIAA